MISLLIDILIYHNIIYIIPLLDILVIRGYCSWYNTDNIYMVYN